jgi:hypothetical protein
MSIVRAASISKKAQDDDQGRGFGMAQVRFAATIAVVMMALCTLAVTGCSLRDSGGGVKNMESYEAVEIAGGANHSKYMSLFVSAVDAISWIVPLQFTIQGETTRDSVDARVSDIAVDRGVKTPEYPM